MKNNYVITAVIALVVSGLVYFALPGKTIVQQGQPGRDGKDGQTLGSASGPEMLYPYMNNNGIIHQYRSPGFSSATTTVCSFRNAGTATSTLRQLTINQNISTTSATVTYAVGTTTPTSSNATSTSVGSGQVSTGAKGQVIIAPLANAGVISPDGLILVNAQVAGLTTTGLTLSGKCSAIWQEM